MTAYGTMDDARAGLLYGLNYDIETKTVPEDETFNFGDPVFVQEGEEVLASKADADATDLVFQGVATISQRSFTESQGEYPEYDQINVVKNGMVWVEVPDGETDIANKAVYVIDDQDDDDYEKFTAVATGNFHVSGAMFKTNPNSDNLAVIHLCCANPEESTET